MKELQFIFNEYVMPKRKQLMDDYGLSLNEADDLLNEANAGDDFPDDIVMGGKQNW